MRPILRCVVASAAQATLVLAAACTGSATDPADACAALTSLVLADTRITTAEHLPAGEMGPAHCKVTGVIETEITFEFLLPDEADWNGRLMMGGGGGFVGSVQNAALDYGAGPGALQRGYATIGTDTGHVGDGLDGSWALNHPERQENFGHRAVHLTAEAGKSILRHYYGRSEQNAYFVGCSRGGGQGMMESQRYPDDFDGIVAGAPAYHWTGLSAQFVQIQQAIYPDGAATTPVITADNLALLQNSILAACDADDGVEDGMLTDPRRCDVAPVDLPRCAPGRLQADCVTVEQLAAIETVYAEVTINGRRIYAGFSFGGENDRGGWDVWIVDMDTAQAQAIPNLQYAFGTQLYKNFVFSDPNWDYTHYDFSTWETDTAAMAERLNATSTDLARFRDAGGKIIYWTGWSDLALSPLATIDYYEKLKAGDSAADDYARLYMLPGVLHCSDGRGPDRVDWIEAIRAWVEEGRAPDRLVASKLDESGNTTLTRPVCPYPQVAVYTGDGRTNDEASFTCETPSS